MNKLLFLILFISSFAIFSQSNTQADKKAIMEVLNKQQKAWSKHNLIEFMQGYWKSDSLKFYGSSGLTYGWEKTLENYKKNYPTKSHTGSLLFKIKSISKITPGAYFVMGEYHLIRTLGNAQGFFMIIFKKIKGHWKIIADTSA